MEPIDRLIAYEEIRQLASRYAVAVDSRNIDALVALFVDDVRVGRDRTGREALRQGFETSLTGVRVTILNVGTHAIELVDEDNATGHVYCHGEVQEGDDWIHQAILYRDTYSRRDGTWLFARRIHELWYGQKVESPLRQEPANWPTRSFGLGTVPESFPTWAPFWAEHS